MKTPKTKSSGFSLAEVLIALFVIVVGMSGITATLWWGMQQADTGKVVSEASNIARICVENIVAQGLIKATPNDTTWPGPASGLNDVASARKGVLDPPFSLSLTLTDHLGADDATTGINNIHSNLDRFTRNISCTRLAPNLTTYDGDLCLLSVRIYWRDERGHERFSAHETYVPHGKVN